MSDSSSIEEQFRISKSSMTSYVVSSLVFEYVLAQNKNKNPKGYKFLFDEWKKYQCTRCNFESNHKIIFELHLFFARHNYLIWRK